MYQPSYRQESYLKESLLHSFNEMKDILNRMSVPSTYKTWEASSPYLSTPSTRGSYYSSSASPYKNSHEQYKSVSPPRYSDTTNNMRPTLRNNLEEAPFQSRSRSPIKSHTAAPVQNEPPKRSSLSPGRFTLSPAGYTQRDSVKSSGSESIKRSINTANPQNTKNRNIQSRKIFFDPFGERTQTVSLGSPVFLTDEIRNIKTPENINLPPSPIHSRQSSHSKTVVFRTNTLENKEKILSTAPKNLGLKSFTNGPASTGEIKAPKRTFSKGRSNLWKNDDLGSVKDEGDSTPSSIRVGIAQGSYSVKHSVNHSLKSYW